MLHKRNGRTRLLNFEMFSVDTVKGFERNSKRLLRIEYNVVILYPAYIR